MRAVEFGVAFGLVCLSCSASSGSSSLGADDASKSAPEATKDWPIQQRRTAKVCVSISNQGQPATGAAFILDTSFYYAMRIRSGPATTRTKQETGAGGRWCADPFVYRHALIAVEPHHPGLDLLSVRWWWPNRFFRSISFDIELDRFAIERSDNSDAVERFLVGAGPSKSGTRFTAWVARLEQGKQVRGAEFGLDEEMTIEPAGGGGVFAIDFRDVLAEQEHVRRHLGPAVPNQRIALEIHGYAVPTEATIKAVRDERPDDGAGVFRSGEYGDDEPFVPGTEIVFERTFVVSLP